MTLDYIKCFKPVDVKALFRHLLIQAEASGIRGVHLTDEAAPPASLKQLAALNREAGLPLVFWGNIRFEKAFTGKTAALLAAGGFIGFSGGIEVAAQEAFTRIGKGISLKDIVNTCAAFKEAGLLVHAYLIYGYWDSSAEEIITSAEIVRQLFEAGLLDSAFWHQFSLTIHSRLYNEKLQGLHPALYPQPYSTAPGKIKKLIKLPVFAFNNISFKGEEHFEKYGPPLDNLLSRWMQGDTKGPVTKAFPFKVPKPAIKANLIAEMLEIIDN